MNPELQTVKIHLVLPGWLWFEYACVVAGIIPSLFFIFWWISFLIKKAISKRHGTVFRPEREYYSGRLLLPFKLKSTDVFGYAVLGLLVAAFFGNLMFGRFWELQYSPGKLVLKYSWPRHAVVIPDNELGQVRFVEHMQYRNLHRAHLQVKTKTGKSFRSTEQPFITLHSEYNQIAGVVPNVCPAD